MATIISTKTSGVGGLEVTGDASGVLQLASNNGTTAVTVDTSGNVGIGTSSPNTNYKTTISYDDNAFDGGLYVVNRNVNSQAIAAIQVRAKNETINGVQLWQAVYGTGYLYNFGAYPLVFGTDNTERMRIDNSGNVLVNATSLASGVNGKLFVNGGITSSGYQTRAGGVGAYGGNGFNINWTGSPQLWIDNTNVGTISLTSDYRIKKNIETNATPALERIAQIRPVTYELADYKELFKEDGVQREGFIAHELQAVIPSAVDGEKDAEDQIQSLKLDALCSVMVKAIQELKAIIDTQAERIAVLENKIV